MGGKGGGERPHKLGIEGERAILVAAEDSTLQQRLDGALEVIAYNG